MSTHTVAVPQAVPLTSEVSSEVEQAPVAEVELLITFGAVFKSFKKSLTPQVKAAAIRLKQAFGVRQGFAGKTLKVEGTEMEWATFVKKHYGVSTRRFNQILEIKDEEVRATKAKPAKKTSDGNKFEDLDSQLHAAQEEITALKAELAQVRAEVNPEEMLVDIWRYFEPEQVQAHLTKIIEALKLGGYLKVEIEELL